MQNQVQLGAIPSAITMKTHHNLQDSSITALPDAMKYRRLVGQLIYLTITRLDISNHVHVLSHFMASPGKLH